MFKEDSGLKVIASAPRIRSRKTYNLQILALRRSYRTKEGQSPVYQVRGPTS